MVGRGVGVGRHIHKVSSVSFGEEEEGERPCVRSCLFCSFRPPLAPAVEDAQAPPVKDAPAPRCLFCSSASSSSSNGYLPLRFRRVYCATCVHPCACRSVGGATCVGGWVGRGVGWSGGGCRVGRERLVGWSGLVRGGGGGLILHTSFRLILSRP